jgi:type IV secretory pathway protease TraF
MVYQGTVRGGVIVLPPGTQLPEGLAVIVQPRENSSAQDEQQFQLKNGIPIFPRVEGAPPITVEFVNQLLDEGS